MAQKDIDEYIDKIHYSMKCILFEKFGIFRALKDLTLEDIEILIYILAYLIYKQSPQNCP